MGSIGRRVVTACVHCTVMLGLLIGMLMPGLAWAQTTAITGTVSDATGGVLPGVTVEASSPVLIEGSRLVVSDSQGIYRIVDLRPGTYAVTFTLPGFSTVLREGIELTTGFTATVDAQLSVGAVEETITVTSASPVVDVQNVVRQEVITDDVLDTLPIAKSMQSFVAIVPGLQVSAQNRDVGGTTGDRPLGTSIHGSRQGDQHIYYDGLRSNNFNSAGTGGGGGYSIYFNPAAISEISLEVGQQAISSPSGGVTINVIPKEGGNTFTGTLLVNGTSESFQSDNLSDDLIAQGLTTIPRNKAIFDGNLGVGGPIVPDRVWFYGAYRRWGSETYVSGEKFFSADPDGWVPSPDETRQAYDQNLATDYNGRVTTKVSENNKLSFALDMQRRCLCYQGITGNVSPEATTFTRDRSHYWQAKWSDTVSSRLLLQAGMSHNKMNWNGAPHQGVGPDVYSVVELSTGLRYRAPSQYNSRIQDEGYNSSTYNMQFSANYVTGSHAVYIGTNVLHARPTTDWHVNGDREYRFLNGEPSSIILRATPFKEQNRMNDLAIYGSDQWTIDQLTLNLGLRYTRFAGYVPEQTVPAGSFVPARSYAEVPDVVAWQDLTPRLGVAYDLFGDARTAVKLSVGKFLLGHAGDVVNRDNPQTTIADRATRSWLDANGDFVPDCDLLNPDGNGECGPISNRLFGQPTTSTVRQDRDTQHGYGKRDYNWEISAGIQHELTSGVSFEAAYFRRSYYNFLVTDNLLVGPTDYDEYCITAPTDPALPGGGGNEICGLYDITPEKFGLVDNFVTFADQFGSQSEVYNGVDLTVNARLPQGASVQGGVNLGRTATNDCEVRPDSPEQRFCDVTPKFLTDVKFAVAYPLPWDVELSATIQSAAGPEITASHTVRSDEVEESLGRPLASGRTATVSLVEPGTLYGERLNQLDLRMAKTFRVDRFSLRGILDLYNLFNASPVLSQNNTYGAAWQRPFIILPGRFVKLGMQMTF